MSTRFDAAAFLSPDQGISMEERCLIDSFAGTSLLLIVWGNREKAREVTDYVGSFSGTVSVLSLDIMSSALRVGFTVTAV